MITKQKIIDEIKRTTKENKDVPLGKARFHAETGISETDWSGKYWVRWSDAICEAGFTPNKMQEAYDDEYLIRKFIELIQEKGKFPVSAEIRMKAKNDLSFPSHNTFHRLGKKAEVAVKIMQYCQQHQGYEGVE